MSEARVPRKVVVPPEGSAPPVPGWLVNGPFTDHDRKVYLAAAQRLGLDVTHWAKQILSRAVRGPLGTSTRQTRAPARLKTLKRPFGHARRRSP
jgi:hypothetical protein